MLNISKVWHVLFIVFLVVSFRLVAHSIPEPYMDEYFHVRQTLQYVTEHDFFRWDPKITTPPGLYMVGFLASKLIGPSLSTLRSVNLIPVLITLLWPLAAGSRKQLHTYSAVDKSLIICGFPLLAFYSTLYYTDVLSTLLVLLGFSVASPTKSALLFFASLWFRQTNIVWAGAAGTVRVLGPNLTFYDIPSNFNNFLRRGMQVGPSYATVLMLFLGFLKWNCGIALGDKSNHGVSLHFAQILYFLMFFILFSLPVLLSSLRRSGRPLILKIFGKLYLVPLEILIIYACIKYGTVVHPFILSDNRHYTFYIWRRLITPLNGTMIIPVYWVAWRWLVATLNFRLVKTWIFIAAVLAVLVPSPLMEPRYYIIPYLVWRLYMYGEPGTNYEHFWNAFINCATMYIFVFSKTHFMW